MKRFLLPIAALLYTTSLCAQDPDRVTARTRIAKQSATETGDRGLFTVPSAETLNKNQFSAGVAWSNSDRTPRDLDISSFPVFVSYGLLGRLTLTGTFETQRGVTARNLAQPGFNNSYPFIRDRFLKGYGDAIAGAKFRLMRRGDNVGGMSLKGFVKFPTGEKKLGLSTNGTDAGVDLIFTSLLPLNLVMHSTMAYTATSDGKDPQGGTIRGIKDEMRSGLGAAWPSSSRFQGIFEYSTTTYVGAGSSNAAKAVQNTSDIAAGVRYLVLQRPHTERGLPHQHEIRFHVSGQ